MYFRDSTGPTLVQENAKFVSIERASHECSSKFLAASRTFHFLRFLLQPISLSGIFSSMFEHPEKSKLLKSIRSYVDPKRWNW